MGRQVPYRSNERKSPGRDRGISGKGFDTSSPEEKRPTTKKAPRTQIEDLPRPAEELSEEEAALVSGGIIKGMISEGSPAVGVATSVANTCTKGNALQGSDSDYGKDM